jgi:hypothetical protein
MGARPGPIILNELNPALLIQIFANSLANDIGGNATLRTRRVFQLVEKLIINEPAGFGRYGNYILKWRTGTKPVYATAEVQNAHLRAASGISLRHSGHFLVVGSGGVSPRFTRAISAFTGTTTRK